MENQDQHEEGLGEQVRAIAVGVAGAAATTAAGIVVAVAGTVAGTMAIATGGLVISGTLLCAPALLVFGIAYGAFESLTCHDNLNHIPGENSSSASIKNAEVGQVDSEALLTEKSLATSLNKEEKNVSSEEKNKILESSENLEGVKNQENHETEKLYNYAESSASSESSESSLGRYEYPSSDS